jgi:CBS domain containing-hemolysin-like protein
MTVTLIIAGVLWLLLGVIQAMRFRVASDVSDFELQRRVEHADEQAVQVASLNQQVPLLESLRYVAVTIVGVLMVTVLVLGLGVINGVLLGVVGLVLAPIAQRLDFVCRFADKFADTVQPYALKVVEWIRPVLSWLRERNLSERQTRVYSHEELIDIVVHSPGVLSNDQITRLRASLAFDDRRVQDVMTPASVIDTVEVRDGLGPLVLDQLHKTGHSRFPVIDGDIHHVVGILYMRELVDLKNAKKTVKDAMDSKVFYVHQDQDLEHALHAFLRTHHHLFIVVNDYRETVGLLSLEDVIESLIGKKIVDEFDRFDDLRAVAESNPRANNQPKKFEDV